MQLLAALGENTSICVDDAPSTPKPGPAEDLNQTPATPVRGANGSEGTISATTTPKLTSTPRMSSTPVQSSTPVHLGSTNTSFASSPVTPRMGGVRQSTLGTPIMASGIGKLPADINFAKDICDVINFENLPDSTGKYIQMSALIKKVRSAVSKIQEDNN